MNFLANNWLWFVAAWVVCVLALLLNFFLMTKNVVGVFNSDFDKAFKGGKSGIERHFLFIALVFVTSVAMVLASVIALIQHTKQL
jgi:hypothetical protein